jgi:hypothetical protein
VKSKRRFLFYADFLGTTESYSDIQRIRIQRGDLERAVQAMVLPNLERHDLHVYIVSDSLFVCCPRLEHLLPTAAKLFAFYVSMTPGQPRLRGAISYGEEAGSSIITNTKRVVAIPLLDNSLPRAVKLEKIRKGSRIFIDDNIPEASFARHEAYLLKWKHITGRGESENNVTEFLWPRLAYDQSQELLGSAQRIATEWLRRLRETDWSVDEYEHGLMIQLDETLKLFIRSLASFYSEREVRSYLFSLLPQTDDHEGPVVFEWGVWFQALKALCQPKKALSSQLKNHIRVVKEVLARGKHLETFLTELEEMDYADFKECVSPLMR